MTDRIFNFSAGPAVLPAPVLERARDEMLNFEGCGMSVMELSHRSKIFEGILNRAESGLRKHLGVPNEYHVLFLQGGASLQFSMIPMNLYLPGRPVDMIHTGAWTKKAMVELDKLAEYRLAGSGQAENFTRLPQLNQLELDPNASYVHLCTNNTIRGTEWTDLPDTGDVPLVADMSSDILSRPIDVSRFGLIFGGAQKNIGPSGVTVVVMRPDLAERASDNLPSMLNYRTHIAQRSLFNTPPTFGIYMIALVMEWIDEQGGISAIAERNDEKAALLYNAIDATDFYTGPVDEADRSKMNVVYRIKNGDEALEQKFISTAAQAGLSTLKGHRSVGGIRASIYNAQPLEAVQALVSFMAQFEAQNG